MMRCSMTSSRTSAARETFVATRRASARRGLDLGSDAAAARRPRALHRSARRPPAPVVSRLDEHAQHDRQRRARPARPRAFAARGTCVAARGGDDRDLVVGGVEADVRARDVVDDDRVDPLARELVAPVVQRALAVLGGEADERLVGPARRREAREDVRRALELDAHALVGGLLQLAGEAARRAEVRDGGGHEQDVGSARTRAAHASCSSAAVSTSTYVTRASRGERDVRRDDRDVGAERAACSASAKPIRPDERLPTKRTASIGSRVPPAVTSTRRPTSSGERRGRGRPASAPRSPRAARRARAGARRPPRRPRPAGPLPGSSTATPRARSVATFACVAGCSHMRSFIAGATSSGQVAASAALVSRLSARPCGELGDACSPTPGRRRGRRRCGRARGG